MSLAANETIDGPGPAAAEPPVAPGAPLRPNKRTTKPPERLTLAIAGKASAWKTPRPAATTAAAATPMTDEFSTAGLAVDDVVEAMGSHAGGREWFKAKIVALRPPPLWPPIHVKYTATLAGVTNALALPDPNTAYVHADMVRKPTA
jgi:hypothetical protein